MGVVGWFLAAIILACCISPARSPAEARKRMLATANRTFGTTMAAITSATKTTVTSSTKLNPPMRSRRVQLFLSSVFIFVTAPSGHLFDKGLPPQTPSFIRDRNGTLNAVVRLKINSSTTIVYEDESSGFRFEKSPPG